MLLYVGVYLLSVFIAAVSQVMLKKAAQREYSSILKEYANPLVIGAYFLFVVTTLMTIYAYKVLPLSFGPILEATSYIYVTIFGVLIFHERFGKMKALALALIVAGVIVYALGVSGT